MLTEFLSDPNVLILWLLVVLGSVVWLVVDLRYHNPEIGGLMKWVWVLTVLYSGLLGLAVYYYSGRKQIARDSMWRRGCRSVAHCYSGCGAGEIAGVFIAAGLLSLNNWWVAGISFVLAYAAGYALPVGPLEQEGVELKQAMWDAFYSETASITVMEVVAIGADLWLAGAATMGEPLFWSSLFLSLSLGLIAAYPVNVLLIRWGVKEGMHDPREMAEHAHGGGQGGHGGHEEPSAEQQDGQGQDEDHSSKSGHGH